jgi:hypothetical protein
MAIIIVMIHYHCCNTKPLNVMVLNALGYEIKSLSIALLRSFCRVAEKFEQDYSSSSRIRLQNWAVNLDI